MSKAVQRVDLKLEDLALGRQPLPEDWLKDIRLRMGLIFVDAPRKDVAAVLTHRLKYRSKDAMLRLDRIMKGIEERPEGFRQEAKRLFDALERSRTAESGTGSTLHEAFLDDVDYEAQSISDERQALATEWSGYRHSLDPKLIDTLPPVNKLLDQAFSESGSDRGTTLREVRNLLFEFFSSTTQVHPIIWLYHGWAIYLITENPDEAAPILARVTEYSQPTVAGHLACRLLAYFADQEGFHARAHEWSKKAIEMHKSPEAYADAALAGAALHDPSLAKADIESALVERSGIIIQLLADDRSVHIGSDILDVAVRVQSRLRREGRQATSAWATSSREVIEAQKICGGGVSVPFELLQAYKNVEKRLASADLISAGYLSRFAYLSAKEVLVTAQKALKTEHGRRCDALSMARKAADGVSAAREHKVRQAELAHDDLASTAEAALRALYHENERSESHAMYGFGGGSILLVLYLLCYAVLSSRDISIGLTSPIGIFMMITAAIPIGLGFWVNISAGVKRSGVEAKVRENMRLASTTLDQAVKEADDFYREQMSVNRKAMAVAEAELKKAELAMRSLGIQRFNESATTKRRLAA